MPAGQDKYVNVLLHSVTLSAINTLTFDEINIGLSTFDRIGLLLRKVEYYPSAATIQDLSSAGDYYQVAITGSNRITDLGSDERSVISKIEGFNVTNGTPATVFQSSWPREQDFSLMPEGGLLIPPRPLYLAGFSASMTVVLKMFIRMYFTTVQLKDAEYFELLETFRFFE